jgi:hypothetical protein
MQKKTRVIACKEFLWRLSPNFLRPKLRHKIWYKSLLGKNTLFAGIESHVPHGNQHHYFRKARVGAIS